MRRQLVAVSLIAVVALTVAACGSGGGGGSGKAMPTVRLAQSVQTISFAPLYVARKKGFFKQQGVNVDFKQLQSGATALQAVVGGSVDVVASSASEEASAAGKGANVVAVEGITKGTQQLCVRRDLAQKSGVSPSSPLPKRIAALKGATIGISGPGAASDRLSRWLVQKYGGLNPNKDVHITTIGGSSAQATALKQGKIQAVFFSAPTCALAGKAGMVLVQPTDIPLFRDTLNEIVYTTKKYAQQHPKTLAKFVSAVAMGNDYAVNHPKETTKILAKAFPEIDSDTLQTALQTTIFPQIPEGGRMTGVMWRATTKLLLESGSLSKPVSTKEGGIWTNKFIRTSQGTS